MKQSLKLIQAGVPPLVACAGILLALLPAESKAQNVTTTGTDALSHNRLDDGDTADGAYALDLNTTGASNTATGCNALFNNNGSFNTADGLGALSENTTGVSNTATGFQTLHLNTTGSANVATGYQALYSDTGGSNPQADITALGFGNVAEGWSALYRSTAGSDDVAVGYAALYSNTSGQEDVAIGAEALYNNSSASTNTACGFEALFGNTVGDGNVAIGAFSLDSNSTGSYNTANGNYALYENTTGNMNEAVGFGALPDNTTGSNNIAIGYEAGAALDTGSYNIDIGSAGVSTEKNTIRIGTQGTQTQTIIAGIAGAPLTGSEVVINANGLLGTAVSSKRFKEDIRDMSGASRALFSLRPVTFRYKHNIDPTGGAQFGLVAEEVDKVNPDLVMRDAQGKPYSVRYDSINAMLLNEFLKQHDHVTILEAKVAEQAKALAQQQNDFQATLAQRQREIETLTASLKEQASLLQKLSAQVAIGRPASQMAANNR
jgi:hypothetical protein